LTVEIASGAFRTTAQHLSLGAKPTANACTKVFGFRKRLIGLASGIPCIGFGVDAVAFLFPPLDWGVRATPHSELVVFFRIGAVVVVSIASALGGESKS